MNYLFRADNDRSRCKFFACSTHHLFGFSTARKHGGSFLQRACAGGSAERWRPDKHDRQQRRLTICPDAELPDVGRLEAVRRRGLPGLMHPMADGHGHRNIDACRRGRAGFGLGPGGAGAGEETCDQPGCTSPFRAWCAPAMAGPCVPYPGAAGRPMFKICSHLRGATTHGTNAWLPFGPKRVTRTCPCRTFQRRLPPLAKRSAV